MATPTFAEWSTQFKDFVKAVDVEYKAGAISTNNLLSQIDTAIQNTEGDFALGRISAYMQALGIKSNLIGKFADGFAHLLYEGAKIFSEPSQDFSLIGKAAYQYFITNSKTVVRRTFTRGSVTAGGSNTGNGTIYTLTTDAENLAIEDGIGYGTSPSNSIVTRVECIADKTTGALSGAEKFRVFTSAAAPNQAYPLADNAGGTSAAFEVNALCKEDADGILTNSHFRTYNSTATHPFTGWQSTSGTTYTDISQDTASANAYRVWRDTALLPAASQTYYQAAIGPTATTGLMQYVKPGRLNPNLPYFVAVRFKGSGTADGNVVLSLGNYASSPLTKSTAVSTSWQTIAINASTARNAWFERFNGQNLSVAVERSSHTAGTVYIDCVLFQPYDYFLGRWFKLVAGSTDFLRGTTGSPNVLPDYFTFTDSMTVPNTAVTGSRQYWWNFFMRLLTAGSDIGRRYSYLPHAAAASETEADYS